MAIAGAVASDRRWPVRVDGPVLVARHAHVHVLVRGEPAVRVPDQAYTLEYAVFDFDDLSKCDIKLA